MMKIKNLWVVVLFLSSAHAVQLSEDGLGEAMIVPFYSVQQNHESELVIKNFTADYKAIKIAYREHVIGALVMGHSVYLAPFDEWRGKLTQLSDGLYGENTMSLASLDGSCAPLLLANHEVLPFEIQRYYDVTDQSMTRSQLGYIEVIEMGTVIAPVSEYITLNNGTAADCDAIENLWNGGEWDESSWEGDSEYSMAGATGGLLAYTNLGADKQVQAVPLVNFLEEGAIYHENPGSYYPDFRKNENEIATDSVYQTSWNGRFSSAVSRYLTHSIEGDFDFTDGEQLEWVLTVLNRNNYVYHGELSYLTRPFIHKYQDNGGCETFNVLVFDTNGDLKNGLDNGDFKLCKTVNVVGVHGNNTITSMLANQFEQVIDVGDLTEGKIMINTVGHWTMGGMNLADPNELIVHYGLPMIANAYEKAAGSNSGIFKTLNHRRKVVLDKIFDSGFGQ